MISAPKRFLTKAKCVAALAIAAVSVALPAHAGKDVWSQITYPYGGNVYALASDSLGTLYAGSYTELVEEASGGSTWSALGTYFDADYTSIITDSSGNVYAATSSGVFKYTKSTGTSTMNDTFVHNGTTCYGASSVAIDNSGNLYATSCGVFKSTNGGTTWTWASTGVSSLNYATPAVSSLTVDGLGNIYVLAQNVGVFKSSNGGSSWTLLGGPYTSGVLVGDSSGNVYEGTQNGVYKYSGTGTTWTQSLASYSVYPTGALAADSSGNVYATTTGGIFKTSNAGSTWTALASQTNPNGLGSSLGYLTSLTVTHSGAIYAGGNSVIFEYTP